MNFMVIGPSYKGKEPKKQIFGVCYEFISFHTAQYCQMLKKYYKLVDSTNVIILYTIIPQLCKTLITLYKLQ